MNPTKTVGGVADTRSLRWMARQREGQMEAQTDEIMHRQMDKGHFYRPPPPTSVTSNLKYQGLVAMVGKIPLRPGFFTAQLKPGIKWP